MNNNESPSGGQVHKETSHAFPGESVKSPAEEPVFEIPFSLKQEHNDLHQRLENLTRFPGQTGMVAQAVAELLHEHFLKEEELAMPLLGLLADLAKGKVPSAPQKAIELSMKLKTELEQMILEHHQIVELLDKLNQAAKSEGHNKVTRFTESLKLHARTEEEVLYPAAILIGEYLKLKT